MKQKKKIILSGGGTGGSVTPLLAIYRKLKLKYDFLFVGTYQGLELKMVQAEGLDYASILSGKWRRYFSWRNFLDIFKIILAFFQSLILLIRERPNMIISAGAFVAVPLSWAAWVLRIPIIIHQQDVEPGLANRIMARIATVITTTFESSACFYGPKARVIGNLGPDVDSINHDLEIIDKYDLNKKDCPIVLVLGGGTGSLFINKILSQSLSELLKFSKIIHISGLSDRDSANLFIDSSRYFKIDFVAPQELLFLMTQADLVVSRCGLGTLTELSFLKKPSILIPMPNSHQELNANEFLKKEAAIVLHQKDLNSEIFIKKIKELLNNDNLRSSLSKNIAQVIPNANQVMVDIIEELI